MTGLYPDGISWIPWIHRPRLALTDSTVLSSTERTDRAPPPHSGPYLVPAFLIAACLAGCGDGSHDGKLAVSGTVKLVGEPIADGTIRFVPLESQGSPAGGPITNGKYDIPAQAGLKPGKYQVQITSGDGKTPANEEEVAGPGGNANIVSFDRVPEDWNVNSQQVIEVAKGKTKFDFDIPTMNTPKPKKGSKKR